MLLYGKINSAFDAVNVKNLKEQWNFRIFENETFTAMEKVIKYLSALVILAMTLPGMANPMSIPDDKAALQLSDTLSFIEYKGKIVDAKTDHPLSFATIAVEGENTATISNSEGNFILKVSKNSKARNIVVSYLGYKNLVFPLKDFSPKKNILRLEPAVIMLNEIVVTPGPAYEIILKVIDNINRNYPGQHNQMTGFYRESIKKRNNYVSLAEAIVNIYKAPYKGIQNDQVRILKGRKGANVKKMDTLLFKLQGGPTTSLLLDIIKNPEIILNRDMLDEYDFKLNGEAMLDGKLNYIISFSPRYAKAILYMGNLYVDVNTYALSAADFHLSLADPVEASKLFIRKKPAGARVVPVFTHYIVKYREQDGKWYFNYAKGEVKFKVKWKKKMFSTNYTTLLEIAITDRRTENVERFKISKRFKSSQIFTETVAAFADKNYWGKYNYIEPEQSIEVAIKKFKRLLRKE